jgi:hypothetical protein
VRVAAALGLHNEVAATYHNGESLVAIQKFVQALPRLMQYWSRRISSGHTQVMVKKRTPNQVPPVSCRAVQKYTSVESRSVRMGVPNDAAKGCTLCRTRR